MFDFGSSARSGSGDTPVLVHDKHTRRDKVIVLVVVPSSADGHDVVDPGTLFSPAIVLLGFG